MILDDIVARVKIRLEKAKAEIPTDELKSAVLSGTVPRGASKKNFHAALASPGISFICEVKKASPSKGIIARDFPYEKIALEYESAGADAVSVLTEKDFFLGDISYLKAISGIVSLPVLRKDFIIDEYQIYEAYNAGASAFLLICSILKEKYIAAFIELAGKLGMDALVETRNEYEIQTATASGARIIGVNNRNLADFSVDIDTCIRLRDSVPGNILFVAESGITDFQDIKRLAGAGVNAVLIGEAAMRAEDKKSYLKSMRGEQ